MYVYGKYQKEADVSHILFCGNLARGDYKCFLHITVKAEHMASCEKGRSHL